MFVIDTIEPASPGPRGRGKALGIAVFAATLLPAAASAVTLSADPAQSTDGVVQLSWARDGRPVELQRDGTPAFPAPRTVYRGSDSASLRTGLRDGDYYYRLRLQDEGDWSAPVKVSVSHHGQVRTWSLFAMGALVFVAVAGLILGGTTRERRHG